jgi:hypothetical protein
MKLDLNDFAVFRMKVNEILPDGLSKEQWIKETIKSDEAAGITNSTSRELSALLYSNYLSKYEGETSMKCYLKKIKNIKNFDLFLKELKNYQFFDFILDNIEIGETK